MSDTTVLEVATKARGSVKFDRLRLDGFKSFADRFEIDIEPGLTGVVGPNGCGKSNLLEALKWALGETSAKSMRGTQMDDVIFSGTDRRPARNMAEVALLLDNRLRRASAEFNDSDTLEVSRRIDRGQGSTYRINGRQVRQRDAQILFQDQSVGSRSSAIVSQGRVSALINAKASERRTVLEEAAGVSGLAARRHDSELKLDATSANLQRAEDSLAQSDAEVGRLRKQAKQLQRWREIDDNIFQATAVVLSVRLRAALEALAKANADHEANEERVIAAMTAAAEATRQREIAVAAIPRLREARSAAETAHARAAAKLESVSNEAERQAKEIQEANMRLMELANDRSRDEAVIEEANRTLTRLMGEQMQLVEAREVEVEQLETASDRVDAARAAVEETEALVGRLSEEIAGREASRNALQRQREELQKRLSAVEVRVAAAESRFDQARSALPAGDALAQMTESVADAEGRLEALSDRLLTAEGALERSREDDERIAGLLTERKATLTRLKAEAGGLTIAPAPRGAKKPIAGMISVEPGYEAAVAAAFGAALEAGLDASEPRWWVASGAEPPALPSDVRTLQDVVSGVEEIRRAAAAMAFVEAEGELEAIAALLPAGFIAVTRSGAFMRWDGYRGRPGASSVEADLKRANRLKALEAEIAALEPQVAQDEARRAQAAAALSDARRVESETRTASRTAGDTLKTLRDKLAELSRVGEESRRKLAVAESEVAGVRGERQTALEDIRVVGDQLSLIPEDQEAKAQLQAARAKFTAAREAENQSRVTLERLTNEQTARRVRLDGINRERTEWTVRLSQARERHAQLAQRTEEAERLLANAEQQKATPAEVLEEARTAAEAARDAANTAAGELDHAERHRETCEDRSRSLEGALATLREQRATLIAGIGTAQNMLVVVRDSIAERMVKKTAVPAPPTAPVETPVAQSAADDEVSEPTSQEATAPDAPAIERVVMSDAELYRIAGLDIENALWPDLNSADVRLARLEREKENLGNVNFLAAIELEEQEKRFGDLQRAREELVQAVKTLRLAIAEIEAEARQKMQDAYHKIDRSFTELFSRLFSGGQAHLKLTGDDILEAGLEIYASPPGKKMQILSLLSGGEQTLTAMALVFAAFLSNPSPICVLDEADAALDDSNTDRLIRLVETMSQNDATRFLVITHSPLTMSRMNRLYGVTMMDRGVSTVTRVDLDRAVEIAGV